MFFRCAKAANGPDGKSYYTCRLVENQREGTKVRQITLLNLGSSWDVPQSAWTAVAHRVKDPAGADCLPRVPRAH